jgi:hypothetical protein
MPTYARRVYLSVTSDDITPDEITRALSLAPDESVVRGSVRPGSMNRRPSQFHAWNRGFKGGPDVDIGTLLRDMYEMLKQVVDRIQELNRMGCRVTLRIVLYHAADDTGSRGFDIEVPLLQLLARIGASIDVDQYLLIE